MPMSLQISTSVAALIATNAPIAALSSANRYLALHSSDPTNACTAGELSGDNYARTLIALEAIALPKGKGLVNSEVIVFPVASATKAQQITHGSIWDSPTGGTPITYGALTAPANWVEGASLSLAVNAFVQLIRNTI